MAAPPPDAATTIPAVPAPAPPGPSSPPPPLPASPCGLYMCLHNISKKANIRTLITSAAAFGAAVIVVGQPTFRIERDVPSALRPQPAAAADDDDSDADPTGLSVLRFDGTIEQCRDWLHAHGVRLLGVEIAEAGASDVDTEPFAGPTALLLGNEGTGMSQRQMRACDGFVYIAQFGTGTASLNVAVAGSVVMHRYALWQERQGKGERGVGGRVGEPMPVKELAGEPTGDCDS